MSILTILDSLSCVQENTEQLDEEDWDDEEEEEENEEGFHDDNCIQSVETRSEAGYVVVEMNELEHGKNNTEE